MTSAPTTARPVRGIAIVASLVLAVTVLAVVVVLTFDARGVASFAPDSPAAAFQRYYTAFSDRRYDTAYDAFSADVQRRVSRDDYLRGAQLHGNYTWRTDSRIRVSRVDLDGERATLVLVSEQYYSSGLTGAFSTQEYHIAMLREGDAWKIDEPLLGIDTTPVEVFQRR